jgi:hypothetical protein
MSYCPICSKELTVFNSPLLNKSKLVTGDRLCNDCYDRLSALYDANLIHNLTPADVRKIFSDFDALVDKIIGDIEAAGFDRQSISDNWNASEMQYLPDILGSDETIVAFANGIYMDLGGIIVATNNRLFFLGKALGENPEQTDFEWDYIQSIEPQVSGGYGQLVITYNNDIHIIEEVVEDDAYRFSDNVAANIPGFGPDDDTQEQEAPAAAPTGLAEADVPAQLEKYAALKDKGVITQSEFDAMKRKLLGL